MSGATRTGARRRIPLHETNRFAQEVANAGTLALPADLGAFGVPGCLLRISPDVALPMTSATGYASFVWALPNNPAFLDITCFVQAFAADPAANTVGVVTTNAVTLTLRGL